MPSVAAPRIFCFGWIRWDVYATIRELPRLNHGSDVLAWREDIGGDAAIVAACCARLGAAVTLTGNATASDARGDRLLSALRSRGVSCQHPQSGVATPWNIAVQDERGNRTWFGFDTALVGATATVASLEGMDRADVVYIDGYLGAASERALAHAASLGRLVVLNLGPPKLRSHATVSILPEHVAVPDPIVYLRDSHVDRGLMTIVTSGAQGAFFAVEDQLWRKEARIVAPVTSSGAGGAFAAGVCLSLSKRDPIALLAETATVCASLYLRGGGVDGITMDAVTACVREPTRWSAIH